MALEGVGHIAWINKCDDLMNVIPKKVTITQNFESRFTEKVIDCIVRDDIFNVEK